MTLSRRSTESSWIDPDDAPELDDEWFENADLMIGGKVIRPGRHRRRRIADSYLDHILIALDVGDRGAPFRDFLDNWYAFTVEIGHLTAADRPIWFNNPCAQKHRVALSKMHFVSAKAAQVLSRAESEPLQYRELRRGGDRSVRLMVDHAVPLRVITEMMFDALSNFRSREDLLRHLMRWYKLGVITSEEDQRLNSARLRSQMPSDWDHSDAFARYKAVGIVPTTVSGLAEP